MDRTHSKHGGDCFCAMLNLMKFGLSIV